MAALKEVHQDLPGIAIDDCWNRIGVWGNDKPRCKELENVIHCVNCKVYSGAGRLLLDRPADQQYIANWSEQLKKEKNKKHENTVSVVIFRIADEWLALSARLFQEVVEMRVVHRVPHSKSTVLRGLINIRGELQLCISMGQLLGIEKRGRKGNNPQVGMGARMVVVANEKDRYVFPVTEVQGIYRYAPSDLQAVPTTAEQSKSNYLSGVLELSDRHVGRLDEGLIFSSLRRILG
jgi:chemotaxis-related protein WspD